MKQHILLLLLPLLLSTVALRGQSFELGLYGGVSYYDGDLGPSRLELYLETIRPAFGAFVRVNMIRWMSFRLGYNNMLVIGDDAISNRRRGLSFRTRIDEIAFNGEINLFRLHLFGGDFYVEPYAYGGAGLFHYNPKTLYQGEWIELQPLGTEGQGLPGYPEKYELWRWFFIGGGGIKIRLSDQWIIGFDGSGRVALTDHIDDVSSNYVVYQDILTGNGPLAAQLSRPGFDPTKGGSDKPFRRGGPARDNVYTVGMTVIYVFGPDIFGQGRNSPVKCPQF